MRNHFASKARQISCSFIVARTAMTDIPTRNLLVLRMYTELNRFGGKGLKVCLKWS